MDNTTQNPDRPEMSAPWWRKVFRKKQKVQPKTMHDKVIYEIKSWTYVIIAVFFIRAGIIEAYQIPTGSMETTIHVGDFLLGNKFIYGARTPDWVGIPFTRIGFNIPYLRLPAFRKPATGDVVIFQFPHDPWTNYVKRCIATPGDSVEVVDKAPYVNGVRFPDPETSIINYDHIYDKSYQEANIFPRSNGNRDQYHRIYIPRKGDTLSVYDCLPDYIYNIMSMDGHTVTYRFNTFYVDGSPVSKYVVQQDFYFMMGDNRDNSYDSRYWGLVPYKYISGTPLIMYFSWDKTQPWSRFYKKIRWDRIFHIVS